MMKKWCYTLCALLLMAGCANFQPILNIDNQVSQKKTIEEVKNAILVAGTLKRWTMTELEPGRIDGKITVRNKHSAHIEIRYSATQYSLHYVDSQGLDADGSGKIHRNYNKWITLLDQTIQVELLRQPTTGQ